VLISSDLPEVMAQSDRVGVFCSGRLTGTFDPRMAAFNGVIGGITGGVGSAFSGAASFWMMRRVRS